MARPGEAGGTRTILPFPAFHEDSNIRGSVCRGRGHLLLYIRSIVGIGRVWSIKFLTGYDFVIYGYNYDLF